MADVNMDVARKVALVLVDTYLYGPQDDHVVVDDLAEAASMVGFSWDTNSDDDMATLDAACSLALSENPVPDVSP